mmetsp:Transcript_62436/g.140758  ORF Transcript_62436/g.140758 Transcript_62436/m.140758 type:complete len:688 (+) Transcript_62436:64-2127(+)|eukprot:CAMPEP_0197892574 /NCGR_PEP_ID=MMETSP1439-20131203/30875_1 /TAXON_ID=66791 /ORGANISM="Gonyaulax spinifera, Strain CCMP409" /LENGTH=687 /DNA_ID=CAMNT_0043512763 /DNA_START=53 /DNA_END=2116 /DNA_ORIENTATION=-
MAPQTALEDGDGREIPSRVRERSLSPVPQLPSFGVMLPGPEDVELSMPPRPNTVDAWFDHASARRSGQKDLSYLREKIQTLFKGPQSFTPRTVEVTSEDGKSILRLAANVSTKVSEIKEIIAGLTGKDVGELSLVKKQGSFWKKENDFDEVSSKVKVRGAKSFVRGVHQFQETVLIIGAGFGGISSAVELLRYGNDNFVILERHSDFGGHSWVYMANRQTKLQTEKGTYHVGYPYPETICPGYMPVWPSRDQLLEMFRWEAKGYGLAAMTFFNQEVVAVQPKGYVDPSRPQQILWDSLLRTYDVTHQRVGNEEEGHQKEMRVGAVIAWPGNLCRHTELTFKGEKEFDGYIEYGSCSMTDYTRTARKNVILYGHGAFMIENVRTLVEHDALMIWVLCRKRNLTTPKMVSWLISQTALPATGSKLLKFFSPMYKLAGFDPWTAHSVSCDSSRQIARIRQKTVFGVTDVYFLACYYGKAKVVIDEIKRLTHHTAHLLKQGRIIDCEVILKVVGLQADPRTDQILGVRELVGQWIQGDAFRPCVSNGTGVNAQNFGTFSVGPGIAFNTTVVTHFLLYPSDLDVVRAQLPASKATEGCPAYSPSGDHFLSTGMVLGACLPGLALKTAHFDQMKSSKQHMSHPLHQFLQECRQEWQMYIEMFGTDDLPPPPYPYTEEMVSGFIMEIYADQGFM